MPLIKFVAYVSCGQKCYWVQRLTPARLLGGWKVGIPLGILPHVWEQSKCSYFPRLSQSQDCKLPERARCRGDQVEISSIFSGVGTFFNFVRTSKLGADQLV